MCSAFVDILCSLKFVCLQNHRFHRLMALSVFLPTTFSTVVWWGRLVQCSYLSLFFFLNKINDTVDGRDCFVASIVSLQFCRKVTIQLSPKRAVFYRAIFGGNGEVSLIDGAESRGQEVGLCLFMLNS